MTREQFVQEAIKEFEAQRPMGARVICCRTGIETVFGGNQSADYVVEDGRVFWRRSIRESGGS